MAGQATIRKQPGGYRKAQGYRHGRWEKFSYKMRSGEKVLADLLRVLKRQGVRHRVLELDREWKVLWV